MNSTVTRIATGLAAMGVALGLATVAPHTAMADTTPGTCWDLNTMQPVDCKTGKPASPFASGNVDLALTGQDARNGIWEVSLPAAFRGRVTVDVHFAGSDLTWWLPSDAKVNHDKWTATVDRTAAFRVTGRTITVGLPNYNVRDCWELDVTVTNAAGKKFLVLISGKDKDLTVTDKAKANTLTDLLVAP